MVHFLYRLFTVALLVLGPGAALGQSSEPANVAILLDVNGAIGPATSEYIRDGLEEARRRQAKVIVLRLNTPGGLDPSMREIIGEILKSPIPVISYVTPSGARAASAGTYIVYASHLAAMAPSTHLGAATPVLLGGGGSGWRTDDKKDDDKKDGDKKGASSPANAGEAKAINDAVAYIRGLAELRGRNVSWAEKAVREAATLTASEAQSQRVIEIVAKDLSDVLSQAEGRTVTINDQQVSLHTGSLSTTAIEPDWRNRILATITNPNIAYILMLIGLYGLLFEFISPGAIFPGVIGGIALLIGLYALNLLPISYAGAGLLLLGIALMIAEAFLPSFGVLGIGGVVSFAVGSLFLFRGDVPGFQLSWPVVATATIASAGFLVIALAAAWRAHRREVTTGEAALLRSAGQVLSWADGKGEVLVMGERWAAKSESEFTPGDRVRVLERQNLKLLVVPDPDAPRKS
ncbi:nodulation protein NfeD [Bradyrhizobium sp. LMTR 3]|uniref:NfeD family protein n=1 Tax=Bradyrhizobium sp. LMTR 3 TaxID=189873 RepID=UPI000810DA89|nr:nodulation protein NfeD [Bradyrhizobium sp. LMTR 3]OCK61277.1 serine protease [Bradyrhizobium sp. LMTR 3]